MNYADACTEPSNEKGVRCVMALNLALKVHDRDNVATVFDQNVKSGMDIDVRDIKGNCERISVRGDVPYGHKIALCDLELGMEIIKYGWPIGAATKKIIKGDYVHIHNLDSRRGRGDL